MYDGPVVHSSCHMPLNGSHAILEARVIHRKQIFTLTMNFPSQSKSPVWLSRRARKCTSHWNVQGEYPWGFASETGWSVQVHSTPPQVL